MPRFLVSVFWLLGWLCLASLAQAQWSGNNFAAPAQFGSGIAPYPGVHQPAPQMAPQALAGALPLSPMPNPSMPLPLPPLPPEIENEAYWPPAAPFPVQHAASEYRAWPQPNFPVQQAAHWQPPAPPTPPATNARRAYASTLAVPPPLPPAAAASPPPQREFNYVGPSDADEGTSTYMAQFDETDDATKDERQRVRTRNFFETGVAGESYPQAGFPARVNARNQRVRPPN